MRVNTTSIKSWYRHKKFWVLRLLQPWGRAFSLVLAVLVFWFLSGYFLSRWSPSLVWLPGVDYHGRLFGLLTILATLQIPVLIFLLDKVLKERFLLRKTLPRTIYLRETFFLLISVNILAYLSPNFSYALFPLILVVILGFRTMYISINVAMNPDDYMTRGYIKKVAQQIASIDVAYKETAKPTRISYKGLNKQLVFFTDVVKDIDEGLTAYLERFDTTQYNNLLRELGYIGHQIDEQYALDPTMDDERLLITSYSLRTLNTRSDELRTVITDQQRLILEKDSYDFAKLIIDFAFLKLKPSILDKNYNLARLIRYNDIMMWWLQYCLLVQKDDGKAITKNYNRLFKDLLRYLEQYPKELQKRLRDQFGDLDKSSLVHLRVFLSDHLMEELHTAAHTFLLKSGHRDRKALRFLGIIENLQKDLGHLPAINQKDRSNFTDNYVITMGCGFMLVAYALKKGGYKDRYPDFVRIRTFYLDNWQILIQTVIKFTDKHRLGEYWNFARQFFIEQLLKPEILDSVNIDQLSTKTNQALQKTTFFSQHTPKTGKTTFLDNLDSSNDFKENENSEGVKKIVKKLAQINLDHNKDKTTT